jgi:D-alanyl-lipoteichoic acid acyltransferase DltB (MBOAT superfamily)
MSYTIDIYRQKMEPTRQFFDYALYVAFFPQLVAGPIERAKHLLPQILSPRKLSLDKFYEGCYLIFWGVFLKVFFADNLAQIVDHFFAAELSYQGVDVLLVSYAFAIQIFCDFAAYSSIARGLGKCLGFDIMINFNMPYFSTNPREFWQRWHISLSTWLRDYLYIPLGGNRKGKLNTYRNLLITMLLGGLWHGAAWNFVIWGAYHGVLLSIYRLIDPFLKSLPSPKSSLGKHIWFIIRIVFFFQLVCVGWLIFRAQSIEQIGAMLHALFFNFGVPELSLNAYLCVLLSILTLSTFQSFQYVKNDLLFLLKWPWAIRAIVFITMFYLLIFYGATGGQEFIYFQF